VQEQESVPPKAPPTVPEPPLAVARTELTPEGASVTPVSLRKQRTPRGAGVGQLLGSLPVAIGAGVLALVLVVAAAWLGLQTWDYRAVQRSDQAQIAGDAASATASRAAEAILSYHYKTLDADYLAASKFLTPSFTAQYKSTFDSVVRPNATKQKADVSADVRATAVISASESSAKILVFVDMTTTRKGSASPVSQVFANRAEFDLVNRDGSWLVDNYGTS
jgi:Mce-associated membrane protein